MFQLRGQLRKAAEVEKAAKGDDVPDAPPKKKGKVAVSYGMVW